MIKKTKYAILYYVFKICTVYMQADEPKIWAELHEKHA